MNILNSLIRLILTSIAIFLVYISLIAHPVYAQNITGSFGRETLITTPNGDVTVEELKSGDRVIG